MLSWFRGKNIVQRRGIKMSDFGRQMQMVLYHSEEENVSVQAYIRDENLWVTQKAMAELYGVDKSGISRHLKNQCIRFQTSDEAWHTSRGQNRHERTSKRNSCRRHIKEVRNSLNTTGCSNSDKHQYEAHQYAN